MSEIIDNFNSKNHSNEASRNQIDDSKYFLASIIESLEDSVVSVDFNTIITSWNKSAEKLYGYSAEEVIGKPLTTLTLPSDLQEVLANIETIRLGGAVKVYETERIHKDDHLLRLWIKLSPIKNDQGEIIGVSTIARDISQHKQSESDLRESDSRLKAALAVAKLGTFEWDLRSDTVILDERSREIFGFSDGEGTRAEEIFRRIDPEDFERVYAEAQNSIKEMSRMETGYRVLLPDGTVRNIVSINNVITGEDGKVLRALGVFSDVTELKCAEESARASVELYETVAKATNDAIWDWNLLTDHLTWNDGVRTLFGYEAEQISETVDWWYEHIHPEDRARVVDGIHRVIDSGEQQWSDEYRFLTVDGSFAEVSDRGFVIRSGEEKQPVRMLGGMTDITERKRAEGILQRYRMLSEKARDIVWMLRPDGQIVEVNQAAVEAYGYSRDELLRMNVRDLRAESTLPNLSSDLKKAFKGGAHFDTVHVRKDGTTFPVEVNANGAEIGGESLIMGIVRDISRRRDAEEALSRLTAQSEQQRRLYETILSTTPDLVYVFGLDHRFTYANQALLTMWGKTWEESIGKNCLELDYEPWHAEMHDREIEQVIATKQPIRGQAPFEGTHGRRIYDYIFVPVFGADGEVEAIAGTTRDVTDSKQAEETLRRTQSRLESVLEAGLAGTFFWDIERDRVVTDENLMRYFSLRKEALTEGVPLDEVVSAIYREDRPKVEAAITEAIEQTGIYQIEYRVNAADEKMYWLSARGSVERDEKEGAARVMSGFAVDITRIKEAEEALRVSEEQLRALADTIPQLAWMAEPDGFIFWYNRRWYEYTGTTPEQMEGWGWETVHDAEILPQVVERWKRSIETGEPFEMEFPLRRGNGEFRWFLTRVNPLRDSQGNIARWFGTNTDIHEKRIAQRNIEFLASVSEDLARLKTVDEVMQSVVAKLGEYLNLSLCVFAEISEAEDKAFVTHNWHRKDVPGIVGVYNLSEYLSDEFQRAGRAGETFVVYDVFDDPRTDGENYRELKIGSFVCVPLVREGQWRFLIDIHDSQPRNWRIDEIELTKELAARIWTRLERARAEEERDLLLHSERQARRGAEQANRLKDEFLATLSHELRTPLNAILGWSQMLLNGNLNEAATARAVSTIERNARAQNQLIDDLLDVSRIITGKLRLDVREVDLSSVIMAAVDAARPAAKAKNIGLQTFLNPKAAAISGDADRLQQIIWNLLSNAIKFTPENGRIQMRLEPVQSHAEITVSDSGIGIEPEFLPYVFERFRQSDGSTTRRHGGLGLGLAIVRQLVELHGGTVSVDSEGEGRGATFTVRVPLVSPENDSIKETPEPAAPKTQKDFAANCPPELLGLRVLLVEDEPDSRDLLNFVLESCGAEVATAASAAEALAMIRNGGFDVIISDIGMPDEDGYSLIRKIRELPDKQGGNAPAIALTAYARAEDRIQALRSGFQMHIAKPVESAELIAVVANLAGRMKKLNENENA